MPRNSHSRRLFVLACVLLPVFAEASSAPKWPQFRGVEGAGVAANGEMPAFFGPASNVVWKAVLAGGNSSPVISGDRLFLTAFENEELLTLCLNRSTGETLWKRGVKAGKIERSARTSHPASSTPCTDGTNLFVYFGSFGALAYDFGGKELWQAPLPLPITQHGASSSPVLAGDLMVILRDGDFDSHLLALNKGDGSVAWRTERPDARRGFSTPLVMKESQSSTKVALVTPGTLRVATYDSGTGRELWTVRGLPNEMCSSPIFGDGLIFVAGWTHGSGASVLPTWEALLEKGDANKDGKLTRAEAPNGPAKQNFIYIDANKDESMSAHEWNTMAEIFSKAENAALAIRPGGTGEVTKSHVAWKQTRGLPYVPTPLLYQGRLYLMRNGGLLTCLNPTTGAPFYQEERIGALGDYYASPVAAAGKVCVISQNGVATIIQAGDELNVLARNPIGESVLATPAIVDDTLYIRTAGHMYAFRASK